MANLYEVTPKWRGNTITMKPKKRKSDRTITFGLGNAIVQFNLAYPPEETVSIAISGETDNVDLYPVNPFNVTRWKQLATEIKDERIDLSKAQDRRSMMWSFKSAKFRKYQGISTPVETSSYMAKQLYREKRVDWNWSGSIHTSILPPSSLGVNATDICIVSSFYDEYIAVLDNGVVTIHNIDPSSMHLIGNTNNLMTTILIDKQEELLANLTAKEIAVIDNKLHIRYQDGICLIYSFINSVPALVQVLSNVISLDGGVRTFSFKYAYDRNSGTTVPLVDDGRDDLSYLGSSNSIVVDGDLYDEDTVVESDIVSSGVIKLGEHTKKFYNIWVNEDGSFRDDSIFNTAQSQYIEDNKTVTQVNQWFGFGDVGHVVPGNNVSLCTLDFLANSHESNREVKYIIKNNTISFPDNPEIEIVDVSGMSDLEKMEFIYTTDTKNKFLVSSMVAEYITDDIHGMNIGYASSPWAEFNSWKEV